MSESLLKQKIREALQKATDASMDSQAQEIDIDDIAPILDEVKHDLLNSDTFPSIINYPCEDSEARSIYEEKLEELQTKLKKWLGEP